MRTLLAALALLGSTFGSTSTAGPILDEAAEELRRDPVYVADGAERSISSSEADELREAIRDGSQPLYVAVLPNAAEAEAGGLNGLPAALGEAVGLRGTYAVVTGNGFRAASNALPQGVASAIATDAFNDRDSDRVGPFLQAFVERVESYDPATGQVSGSDSGSDSGGGGIGVGTIVILVGAVALGIFLFRNSAKRRKQEQAVLIGDQEDLRASLSVLADDVLRLEPEVDLHPEARDDYEAAVARFKWAQAAIDGIDSPDDVPRVRRGMAEAQYAMARARAIVQGREPPAPPPELQNPGAYGEPAIHLDERRQPQYAGYEGYGGGWGGGGFFGGNGLFTGLLLGHMLGGMGGWGGGFGWGGGGQDHPDGGILSGGGGVFGSGGGGDWGGGGGGDWGGGGGGDW